MRKILIFLILVLIVFISYMFFLEKTKSVKIDTQAISVTEDPIKTKKVKPIQVEDINLKKEILDDETLVTNKWMKNIREIFELELLDDPDAYDDYQSMKASFEEDRIDAYDEFMDQVRKENKTFNITELEDGKYKEVEEEYLKAFQKRYGQKVFLKYLEAIEKHNESNPSYPLYF